MVDNVLSVVGSLIKAAAKGILIWNNLSRNPRSTGCCYETKSFLPDYGFAAVWLPCYMAAIPKHFSTSKMHVVSLWLRFLDSSPVHQNEILCLGAGRCPDPKPAQNPKPQAFRSRTPQYCLLKNPPPQKKKSAFPYKGNLEIAILFFL